ncbi:MAG: lamin tail domain-containing protein [Patescibacteria group bacterium]|nr:lamin tail domain-containing protein [Patescibacteria group bacterium]
MKQKLLLIFLLLIIFSFQNQVFGYSIETHAYLTKEIINFYNQNFQNKISNELVPYLIDGSRKEDEPPRWMNHFYDPIYNRGLTEDSAINPEYRLGNWQKSKDWANDSSNQNNIIYKTAATIYSLLSAIQQKKIELITFETDFTWDRALKFYIQGEKEKAMYILGHILHLIEDKSVPDHTRNDPHALGSPYEKYTSQYNLNNYDKELTEKLKNKKPIILNNLNDYFNNLATYSNNNFYSKDTIGIQSGYNKPQPDYDAKIEKYFYAIKIDKENGDYYLFRKSSADILFSNKFDASLESDLVMSSYWSRLSTKAVQYGAGVIDLFFREAKANENNPKYLEKELSFWGKIKNTTSNIINSIQSFGSQVFETTKEFINYLFNQNKNNTYEIPITNNQQQNQIIEQNFNPNIKQPNQLIQNTQNQLNNSLDESEPEEPFIAPQINQNQTTTQKQLNNQTTTQNQTTTKQTPNLNNLSNEFKQCSFQTNQTPSHQGLIINEIAWMGTPESSNNEWIELKNISNQEIDINNWQLIDRSEQIKINFAFLPNTKIKPGQFLILERTSENTLPNIKADLIYTGALSNSDEGLRLFDKNCNLIDEVLATPSWPAGNSLTRQTAERKTDLSWQTSANSSGTPKNENSSGNLNNLNGGGGGKSSNYSIQTQDNERNQNQQIQNILISEIQIYPTNQRFIELYNPNNFDIDLTGYYIQRKTKTGSDFGSLVSKTNFEGKIIKAKSFFLISRENLPNADIVLSNLTLSNSNSIQLIDKNKNISDLVGWGEAQNCQGPCALEIGQNQSLQRKFDNGNIKNTSNNLEDFEISNCPSPKDPPNQNCVSTNQASKDAFLEFSNVRHILISEIFFDANGSDEEKEFIELYNPTVDDIDLTNWSIKILKNNTTTEQNLIKLNQNSIIKKNGGFFLVGFYKNSNNTDQKTSASIPNDFQAIILYDKNNQEIDRFNYNIYKNENGPVLSGYSIERKAYKDDLCLNPESNGKFLGNGCDYDLAQDFITNPTPNPQSSNNLKEPRKPPEIINLEYSYDNQNANIKFLWGLSQDDEFQTSTITYKIIQNIFANSTSSNLIISTSTILESLAKNLNYNSLELFEKNINIQELNKNYNYEFQVIDRDGLISTSSINIFAKSFIEDGYFFKDDSTGKYYFKIKFNPNHQFFNLEDKSPDSFMNYEAIVFYLNQEPTSYNISTENGLIIPNANQIQIQYPSCAFGPNNALIFPQNQRSCIKLGGPPTWLGRLAYDFNSLESDNSLIIELLINQDLNENDYITLGFYKDWSGNIAGTYQIINFKALDSKKYYLLKNKSFLNAPTTPQNIQFNFDETNFKLRVSADYSTDPDSKDSNIYYEYNFSDSENLNPNNWQITPVPNSPNFEINVQYGKKYIVSLRAIDEFKNVSKEIQSQWSFPENFIILQEQNKQGDIANGNALNFAQVFKSNESGYLSKIKIKFQIYWIPHNYLRGKNVNISIYKYDSDVFNDDVNLLNQSINDQNKLGTSNNILNYLIETSPEIAFNFNPKIYLEKNKLYVWVLNQEGGFGHLAGTSEDQQIGGYGYATYSGTSWFNQRNWLALTNYYFILIGEK